MDLSIFLHLEAALEHEVVQITHLTGRAQEFSLGRKKRLFLQVRRLGAEEEVVLIRHIIEGIEDYLSALPTSTVDDELILPRVQKACGSHAEPSAEAEDFAYPASADQPNAGLEPPNAVGQGPVQTESTWSAKQHAFLAVSYRLHRKKLLKQAQHSLEGQLALLANFVNALCLG